MSWKKLLVMVVFVLSAGWGVSFFYKRYWNPVRDVDYLKDHVKIETLFHKGDNWWWLICNEHLDTYSVDHTLKYKSSSQYEKRHDLIMKVWDARGKIAGFTAYYPKSPYTWQFLFLLVDQDFRRQGIAKKLLTYAVKDMVARGALKIDLVTRVENSKAQDLYKKFGFRQTGKTEQHVMMTWHVSWGMHLA